MKKTKSILITGAAGCIGSNLVKWLIRNHPEYRIISVDNLSGGFLESIPIESEIYIRDISDDLTDIFEKYDVKIIFHMAAIASEALSPFNRKHYYNNNIVASANVINFAIKYDIERLVFFSSMAVYGHNSAPFIESQTPIPQDPYGAAKLCIEHDLWCAKEMHNLRWTIVRPHSVYGVGQVIEDRFRNVLGIFIRQILNNEPCSIYGDGLQKRAFTDVEDIMLPLWKCATSPETLHETFNLGNDDEMTILEALETLEEVVGKKVDRKYYQGIHEVRNAFSDHSKAREILGLECKTSLKDGLQKMWNWAKDQPKRELQTFDSFELEVGLPEQFKK